MAATPLLPQSLAPLRSPGVEGPDNPSQAGEQLADGGDRPKAIKDARSSCKDCAFAVYNSITQTGCLLGRTEKYSAQGSLLEVYDADKEFYLVNGRRCNAYRDNRSAWGQGLSDEEKVKKVRDEIRVRADLVVLVDGAEEWCERLARTLSGVLNQTTPFVQVVVCNNAGLAPDLLRSEVSNSLGDRASWRLTHVQSPPARPEKAIDLAVKGCVGDYYVLVKAGHHVSKNFVAELDRTLNEELVRFAALLPDEDGGPMVVPTILHKLISFGGNEANELGSDLVDKIQYVARDVYHQPDKVKKVSECLSLR